MPSSKGRAAKARACSCRSSSLARRNLAKSESMAHRTRSPSCSTPVTAALPKIENSTLRRLLRAMACERSGQKNVASSSRVTQLPWHAR
jgi:hypothetical protein